MNQVKFSDTSNLTPSLLEISNISSASRSNPNVCDDYQGNKHIDRSHESDSSLFNVSKMYSEGSTLEVDTFIEPLFEKIVTSNKKSVSYSDMNDMSSKSEIFEPLFSKLIDPGSERFDRSSEGDVENNYYLSISSAVKNIERATGRNVITIDATCNVGSNANFMQNANVVQNRIVSVENLGQNPALKTKVNDVTVYPQELSSLSQCLYFTSTRSNRLKLLRDTAIWRSIGLLCGWLFTLLFMYWLSSYLSLTSFPENPFKFFLSERKSKKKKEKVDTKGKMLPITCYEELYEFSKWDKFTKERPMTRIFYQGKTYRYDKLPK